MGLAKREDVEKYFTKSLKKVYPIFDLTFRRNLETVLKYTDKIKNLIPVGRQGLFKYVGMSECIDMGFTAADAIKTGFSIEKWKQTRERFDHYSVLD